MSFLQDTGVPVKQAFLSAAEVTLNSDLVKAFQEEAINADKIQNLVQEMQKWDVTLDSVDIEFTATHKLVDLMETLFSSPSDLSLLLDIQKRIELLVALPINVNNWQLQNVYYKIMKTAYGDFLSKANAGDADAKQWIDIFKHVGEMLFFNIQLVLPEN